MSQNFVWEYKLFHGTNLSPTKSLDYRLLTGFKGWIELPTTLQNLFPNVLYTIKYNLILKSLGILGILNSNGGINIELKRSADEAKDIFEVKAEKLVEDKVLTEETAEKVKEVVKESIAEGKKTADAQNIVEIYKTDKSSIVPFSIFWVPQ